MSRQRPALLRVDDLVPVINARFDICRYELSEHDESDKAVCGLDIFDSPDDGLGLHAMVVVCAGG